MKTPLPNWLLRALLLAALLSVGGAPGLAAEPPNPPDAPAALKTFGTMGKEVTPLSADREANTFSAYRFHEDDLVFFQRGLRLTCRCGEKIGDKVFHNSPPTRYTTYVWLYQW